MWTDIFLVARIIPRPIWARKFTMQFLKYPLVLYFKRSPKVYLLKLSMEKFRKLTQLKHMRKSLRRCCSTIVNETVTCPRKLSLFARTKLFQHSRKGVARGASGVHVTPPPFLSLFVSKQPTIFRWQSGEYSLYDSVWTLFKKSWLRPCHVSTFFILAKCGQKNQRVWDRALYIMVSRFDRQILLPQNWGWNNKIVWYWKNILFDG